MLMGAAVPAARILLFNDKGVNIAEPINKQTIIAVNIGIEISFLFDPANEIELFNVLSPPFPILIG
jgi:hypothetical protein